MPCGLRPPLDLFETMTAIEPTVSLTPRELVKLLIEKRWTWLGATALCGALAVAYAFIAPRYWEASQALVVRQETAGAPSPSPGKFTDLYEMRTLQETILELAKSRQVVVDTLIAVDSELKGAGVPEPNAKEIEKFRKRMKMVPPNGAEFGKTEVFYFEVKDTNRDRAMKLVAELCNQLDKGLRRLRAERAANLIVELQQEVAQAGQANAEQTALLQEFEAQVGADLGELRMLQSGASGQSDLRQESVQLGSEVRRYQTQVREAEKLLALLRAAQKDPQQLIATPNSLLAAQPALRRIKDGLIDAQLATSRMVGSRSPEHPRVKAAIDAEHQIRDDLHRELKDAIRGAEIDLDLSRHRCKAAEARARALDGRLGRLANLRAEYSNRVAAVENSHATLDRARQSLSVAKAFQAAAQSGSLVTRIDSPETGPYPSGPGRTVIAGTGAIGGLFLGLGLVFMSVGPKPTNSPQAPGAIVSWTTASTAIEEEKPQPITTVEPASEPQQDLNIFASDAQYALATTTIDPLGPDCVDWRPEPCEKASASVAEWWDEPALNVLRKPVTETDEVTSSPAIWDGEELKLAPGAEFHPELDELRPETIEAVAQTTDGSRRFESLPPVGRTLPTLAAAGPFRGQTLEEAVQSSRETASMTR